MESDYRYYTRRAITESNAAVRAVTPQARDWHRQLADGFARRARELAGMVEAV